MSDISRLDFLKVSGAAASIGAAALLSSCSQQTSTTQEASQELARDSELRLGLLLRSTLDPLSVLSMALCRQAAQALDFELMVVDHEGDPARVVAGVESLIAAGCTGVVVQNVSDADLAAVIARCEEQGIFLAQTLQTLSKELNAQAWQAAYNSSYFAASVAVQTEQLLPSLVELLCAPKTTDVLGSRFIAPMGWSATDSLFQLVFNTLVSAVTTWNEAHQDQTVTLFEPTYAEGGSASGAQALSTIMEAHGETDTVFVLGGGGSQLEGTLAQIDKLALNASLHVAALDSCEAAKEAFDSKTLRAAVGGQHVAVFFSLLTVYQACKGSSTPTSDTDPLQFSLPAVLIEDSEGYERYQRCFIDNTPYNDAEIKELAGLNSKDLASRATKLSLDDIASRHHL